jgi:hypothetical protein
LRILRAWWPVVCFPAALLLATPAPAAPGAPLPALPDSVLATVGPRVVTSAEFFRQWENLGPRLRPTGVPAAEAKRAFLNELMNKEALSLATEAAGFTPTPDESTRLANLKTSLLRQEYYRRMVLDSLPPAGSGEDAESARAALAGERESRLIERLVAPLKVRFDDAVAARLAHAFALLPVPREEGPGWLRVQITSMPPPVLPGDTAQVLATTSLGRVTVGDFLWYWARVPASQRDRADSAQAVVDWAKSFLAQGVIDAACLRAGYDRLPQVQAQLEARRQVMAVEDYYQRTVVARVDTSDAKLEAEWEKDPARFHGPPYDRYHAMWYVNETPARAAVAALERGATWDSLWSARFPVPADPQRAIVARAEAGPYRDTLALARTAPDSTLTAWFAAARPGQAFGPRVRTGQWWIYQFLEHRDGKRNNFGEARPLVLQQVLADEGESLLTTHLEELLRRYGARVNEAALAALVLPPDEAPGEPPAAAPPAGAPRPPARGK